MREQDQIQQLARMRRLATVLLIVMAVVFVLARIYEDTAAYIPFIRAFAEAALVGALADWFAVTALFRRPLGLPIPHTAIIPENKDRIGASVANFLEYNFMTRDVLIEELEQIDFAGMASEWLAQPQNSRSLAVQAVSGLPAMLQMVEDDDVARFLQKGIHRATKEVRLAPMLAEVISVLVADRRHQQLFDQMIAMAARALRQNQSYIWQRVQGKTPSWMPRIVDEKIFERLLSEAQEILDEMNKQDSPWRERFQQSAEEWVVKLRTEPEYEEKFGKAIGQMLGNPLFQDYVQQVWRDIKGRLLADVRSDESKAVAYLDTAIRSFGETLRQDAVVQQKLNRWLHTLIVEAVVTHRGTIAGLIDRVIRKWDAETVSRKFETYVGKDLQYIRINGTLVGGLVGLVLHTVSLALS
jgi:uncharacterized membrane-anchored protein YjiN (DUF445 family)